MHTPGHTPEHISFLVTDTRSAGEPTGIFSGDFVFVGDVGRPDLLERAAGVEGTMEPGARQLFRSLQRFKQLPDYLQVWPAHGAGSACGKSLGAVPQSTVGYEKRFNWALTITDEDEFVREVLAGQPEPPAYFAQMKVINKVGPEPRPKSGVKRQTASGLERALQEGMPVVDTRSPAEYAEWHVPSWPACCPNRGSFSPCGCLRLTASCRHLLRVRRLRNHNSGWCN
jgi:hydroxyacylglutathione hydrolase